MKPREYQSLGFVFLEGELAAKVEAVESMGHRCYVTTDDPHFIHVQADLDAADPITCPNPNCKHVTRKSWLSHCPACDRPLSQKPERVA